MNRLANRLRLATGLIVLTAAIISLCTSLVSLHQSSANKAELTVYKGEIEKLKRIAEEAALVLTIDIPKEGRIITADIYDDMRGAYTGGLPQGYSLWVLAKDRYNYFLMYPPTQVTDTMKHWSQKNIRLATPGTWELHVCVANDAASKWLEERAENKDWRGFAALPEGMKTVKYVTVEKR